MYTAFEVLHNIEWHGRKVQISLKIHVHMHTKKRLNESLHMKRVIRGAKTCLWKVLERIAMGLYVWVKDFKRALMETWTKSAVKAYLRVCGWQQGSSECHAPAKRSKCAHTSVVGYATWVHARICNEIVPTFASCCRSKRIWQAAAQQQQWRLAQNMAYQRKESYCPELRKKILDTIFLTLLNATAQQHNNTTTTTAVTTQRQLQTKRKQKNS